MEDRISGQFAVVNEFNNKRENSASCQNQPININNLPLLYVKLEKIDVNNLESAPCTEIIGLNNVSSPIYELHIVEDSDSDQSIKDSNFKLNTVRINQNISNSKVGVRPKNGLNYNWETAPSIAKKQLYDSSSKAKILRLNKRNIEEEIQIKQEEIHIVDVQESSTVSGNGLPKLSKTNNAVPKPNSSNGMGGLRPMFQSILSDIVVLRREYKRINEASLDKEVDRMRAKHKLPSLKDLDNIVINSDSEPAECSSQGSGDDSNNTMLNVKDVQMSGQIMDAEDFVRLIEDDSAFNPTNNSEKHNSKVDTVEINGMAIDIQDENPECPGCAKMFKASKTLKQHLKICPLLNSLPPKDPGIKIDQVFSVEPAISNPKQPIIPGPIRNKQPVKVVPQPTNPKSKMARCFVSKCSFRGPKIDILNHLLKEHSNYHNVKKVSKKPKIEDEDVIEIDDD